MTKLFTVTLTDLATYTVTVAADTPEQANDVAKTVLFEEATPSAPGLTIVKRDVDAQAEPVTAPSNLYRVHGVYSIDFAMTVPAHTRADAELNARRLYAESPFPWEHDHTVETVKWRYAEEVQS